MSASGGYITSVDPINYMAKVMLQPAGVETGWLPIGTWYAGNGFGLVALPDLKTEVTVIFEMGDLNSGKILLSDFNKQDLPPASEPGEVIFKHKSGSILKFDIGGNVEVTPAGQLILCGGGQGVARVGDATSHTCAFIGRALSGAIISGSSKAQSG
jgi:phage baseplate assembly protein gpV